ncbi:MAG: 3-ketoacyl-ACP reductase [Bacteroidales bacterium]|nr:3-ketoacyl-ACP reductase [Bacteroidales bacterium]
MRQVALVTGGTRGIGLGIAQSLASKGYNLALNGMRPVEQIEDVIADLHLSGVEVIYCRGNVAMAADRKQMWEQMMDRFGKLNLLVNNAGMGPRERLDILQTTEDSYHEVMDVNLTGPYFLTQQAANHMVEEKKKDPDFKAAIINISSISATLASVNRGEYCISKAGMSMMTQLFAVRLGEYNIPVYEVRPGVINTDMTAGVKDKYDRLIEGGLTLQKRWGLPEDVGRAVGSLATGDLAYSTGQVIMVDGGLTIGRL